jgi:HEAT repeat protein
MIEQETIEHLIKTFRLAVTNLRIYPPSSTIVAATVDTLHKTIHSITEQNNSLTFSLIGDKFLIDGTETKNREIELTASTIVRLFHQKKTQSVTFKKGVALEELSNFLVNLLTKKREDFPQFEHILLDTTVYVATVKGEDMVVKIKDNIKQSGGDIAGLLKSIRESYDLIDSLPNDHDLQQELQGHLAEELAKQDASVLREIFDREMPPRIENSGIKRMLLGSLSKDKIQEIFGDIAGWFDEIRKKEGSDFDAIEQLEKLKGFIHTLLQAPAAREFPRQFFEDLVRKGLLTEVPSWVSHESAQPTTIFEAERLLEKKPGELLDSPAKESLPGIIEKLCHLDYNELIVKLVEKLLENIKSQSSKVRLVSAEIILKVSDVLYSANKENILKYTELPVLEAAKAETSSDVYGYFAELLRKRAVQNILHEDTDSAVRIVELLHLHNVEELMPEAKIRNVARAALEKLLPEVTGILVEDLRSSDEKKRSAGILIFSKFGALAIDPLIKIVKESEDVRARKSAALILKNLGEKAKKSFAEELNLGLTQVEIKRVVEALSDIGDDDMTEHLNILLRYPDPMVKKDILRFLAAINTNQSRILLIDRLKDEDYSVVSEAARLLAQTGSREAVPSLIALLNSPKTPVNVREEICIFLGTLNDHRAVPALIASLSKKIYWFTSNKADTERVKMRAAWALRKFRGPEVESALKKASSDKSISVSMTAKESLAAIAKK